MTAVDILEQAAAEGVVLTLSPTGGVAVTGDRSVVDKWLPAVRDNKPGLVLALREAEQWREFLMLLGIVAPAYNTPTLEYAELQDAARHDLDNALIAFREMSRQVRS